jgi:hypothetical protein
MANEHNKLTGLPALSHMGVEPYSPPQLVYYDRDPTPHDRFNFRLGCLWVHQYTNKIADYKVWILAALENNRATWLNFQMAALLAVEFKTQNGIALPNAGGVLEVFGAGLLNTDALIANRVTGNITNGVLGEFLQGGGAAAHWGPFISSDASVTIVPGANDIDLTVGGVVGPALEYDADNWPIDYAVPILGILNVLGDGLPFNNIYTTAGGNTVRIHLSNDVHISGTWLSDTASIGGNISLSGNTINSTNINGNIILQPNNSGNVKINNNVHDTWIMDANGYLIMPYQAAFMAYLDHNLPKVTGNAFGTAVANISCNNVIFDQHNNYNPATFTFVAPKTGKYYFVFGIRFYDFISVTNQDVEITSLIMQINGAYARQWHWHGGMAWIYTRTGLWDVQLHASGIFALNAGDLVTFWGFAWSNVDINNNVGFYGAANDPQTFCAGYLIC